MPTQLGQGNGPLAGLDTNQYNFASFTYPQNAGNEGSQHFIIFNINETSTTQFQTRTVNGAPPTDLPTIIANANADAGVANTATTNANIRRVATTVVLYFPPDMISSLAMDWDVAELGVANDISNALFDNGSLRDLAGSFGASGLKSVGNAANQFTNLSVTDTASAKTRLAINNHPEVIFKGIGFRTFQFKYKFLPQTEADAQLVDNIIRAFRFYSVPEVVQNTSGRFWIYPGEFDIKFISNGSENLFINRISTCALTNVDVNYTGSGEWAAFRQSDIGAPPVCTQLTLTFKELELMQKLRILNYY